MKKELSREEFVELFLKFEDEYNMFSVKVNNVKIWHYIRYRVFYSILRTFEVVNQPPRAEIRIRTNADAPKETFNDWLRRNIQCNQFRAGKRDVLMIPHRRKYKDSEGYGRCIYTDLLDKSLTRTHYILDGKNVDGVFEKQRSKNVLYLDIDEFKQKVKAKWEYKSVKTAEFETCIIKPIEKFWGIGISLNEKRDWLNLANYALQKRADLFRYYHYMLKKMNPKIVLLVVGCYSIDNMILCEAAKRRNIPVVELQHGAITDMEITYNYRKKKEYLWFPDYIFTFGSFDKINVRYPIDDSRVIPVGYPELESYCKKKSEKKSQKKTLLFISTRLTDIAQYARFVAEQLDNTRYRIVYKLHPQEYGEWREVYGQYLEHPNIEVVGDYNHTVYDYLVEADWVIGSESTVLYEAAMFDVKIAIIKTAGSANLRMLYENEIALLVDSYEELVNAVVEDSFEPNTTIKVFEKNSLSNMTREINRIIEENNVQKHGKRSGGKK